MTSLKYFFIENRSSFRVIRLFSLETKNIETNFTGVYINEIYKTTISLTG